ncbi:glycosyltransferase family 4 protein [Flagellimonas hymeniacidonis]|uniref:Glycosyltransferase family 4 protein n=1 Tax=Flagellimonas hymeniacidonis TaxID=2603628 RepID=A0A5C8V3Q5_9FLAO|nr:glycosyltransferase family 4 protein [Flagellimonas hymeniacidonis]TXN35971.1 glycosyltransferase family 4 protein [Flagellimonas hymeniacidonis]
MNRKKKISFVIGSLSPGGAERVVTTLANELSKVHSVCIITLIKSIPYYTINKNVKVLYCAEKIAPSKNSLQALKTNFQLYKKISSLIHKEKIDLLIGFITSANILSVLAAKRQGIPCIISERNFPMHANTPKMWKILRRLLYRKSDFLVVQTEEIRDYFKSLMPEDKILILANPIAPEISASRDSKIKKENIVLNVGRLTYQKSQDTLIRAFANIENKNWKLLIIGEGNKRMEYEDLIQKLKLGDRVLLVGNTNDMPHYYNRASIFAFPSRFEGFPNALLEAMHFGLPCVSTDCPTGPSKLINNGSNGFLIPIDSPETLEKKLSELINNDVLRGNMGKKAVESTIKFETAPVTEQWNDVINRLV